MQIPLDSWRYLREQDGLLFHGYVVLENHLHFIARAERLDSCASRFKSFTARQIIDYLQTHHADMILDWLRFTKQAHKTDREHQFWQEGAHAEMILNDSMMMEKLEYIHGNPVKRGYVDKAEDWRYSSTRNYAGNEGLIAIDPWC